MLGQVGAPDFHIAQEGFVHAQHAFGGALEQLAVQSRAHGFGRQRLAQPLPGVEVLRMRQIQDARFGRGIALPGFDAAIIDGEFGEVGQYAQRGIARPAVGSQLFGRLDGIADVDGWLLGLDIEDAPRPRQEAVIGMFDAAAAAQAGFMQHLLAVAHIPAQRAKEGIDEFLPQLRLVVIGLLIAALVALELLDQLVQAVGCGH